MTEVLQALEKFRDEVVKEARSQLAAKGKNSSGALSKSIQGEVKQMPNSIGIYFKMLPYGNFQDKGVNGTQINHGAPYSFKSKGGVKGLKGMPPPSKLDSWMVRKGIAPRNAGGQFTSRKGLQFLIARGIFKKGIKPSLFFTKPFEDAFRSLPDDLVEKYGLDMEQDLLTILQENLRRMI
jgi:hypothetical protein